MCGKMMYYFVHETLSKTNTKTNNELRDFIGKSEDVKEVRRTQAILLLNVKTPYKMIAELTGFKERAVLVFRQCYLKNGLKGIEHKRKGKPKALLSRVQQEEIIHILTKTTPQEHGYESEFWSTSILGHLIKEKYKVIYKSKKSFYLLFEEAQYSFHKPGQVYEKRDEVRVSVWKKEIKPKVEHAWNDPNTVLLCEDEMMLSSQTTFQKVWLKKGVTSQIIDCTLVPAT